MLYIPIRMISLSVLFCSSCPTCFLYFRRYCEVIYNFNTYDEMFSCVFVNLYFQRTIDGQEPYVVELKGYIVSIVVFFLCFLFSLYLCLQCYIVYPDHPFSPNFLGNHMLYVLLNEIQCNLLIYRIWISGAMCRGPVCVQWFVVRSGCSFCSYLWNC